MHARAAALFGHELLDRLEEVDVQAGQRVDAGELRIGGASIAIIADQGADDRAVLLLDMGAVVLLIGAAAGEGDALALAPRSWLMNSDPLSLSTPRKGMGRRWRTWWIAVPTRSWPLPHTAWSSTQLVATSTAQRV
jgi:hypothetical protein